MRRRIPGLLVLAVLAGIVGVALAGLAIAGGSDSPVPWRYIRGLIVAGFIQAGLSTVLSLTLGALIALALARRTRFPGRSMLIAAMNVATVLPAIVTVFAMVAVFGRSGWLNGLARLAGTDLGSWIYGLDGILIAHVFFNAPLAARVFLAGLGAVAPEYWRLATQLGMPASAVFRMIDLPVLRREAAGIGGLIFLACFTSFAIVLALGGGPGVATLEVAIFEALRFEADFRRAAILALLQIAVCLALLAPLAFLLTRRAAETASSGVAGERPDRTGPRLRALDAAVLAGSAAFILAPLAAVLVAGLAAIASLWAREVGIALLTSVAIGVPAGCLAVLASVALASLARSLRLDAGRKRTADTVGLAAVVILVVSPIALSAGLFVVLRRFVDPFSVGLPLIVIVNAMMALPFTYRQVEPPLTLSGERYGRLADSLGIAGFRRAVLVDWPLLRGPLVVALAMAIALSFGDLGVAAFFGTGRLSTLPLLLYEKLGTYRMAEAASVALLLAGLVLALFLAAQRWSGGWLARSR
jgi:thiamine transport system permease protein